MIEAQGLCKSFGPLKVLKDCSLKVADGETVVVIGQSGTGKSVLLKAIAGLLKPDAGRVLIDGQDRAFMDEATEQAAAVKMGFLFQNSALFDSFTVWENVTFGLRRHRDLTRGQLRELAEAKLNLVGLRDILDKKPAELSGGMRKRVGLARAIAMDPKVVLYDEPTTGLDPIMADAINDLILELKVTLKIGAVAVTHDMTSAYKIADRIAMLYQGGIVAEGSVEEFRNSGQEVVQQFIHGRAKGPIQVL